MTTAEDLVIEKNRPILCVLSELTILETIKVMTEHDVGAVYVKENDKIVGRWTERHLTRDMMTKNFDIKLTKIKEVMHTNLYSVPHSASIYNLLDNFIGNRVRRLLVEKNGEYIGYLYVFDIMKQILNSKNQELKELNAIVSWEYFKRWGH